MEKAEVLQDNCKLEAVATLERAKIFHAKSQHRDEEIIIRRVEHKGESTGAPARPRLVLRVLPIR